MDVVLTINLPLKTEPFLSYRNRLECVSPLLLAETHKLFSLQTLGIYSFSHVKNVHFQAREWISGNFRQEIPGWLSWSSSPQSLVRRPAAAAALSENLLETQIPGVPPKTYGITNSEGWRPAKASESLSVGSTYNSAGQVSDKERPHDHRCVAYLKHFMKHVWRPKSKASSSMKHSLMHSWKWNYISPVLLLLKFPGVGRGLVSYSLCFILQCPACHLVTDPFKYEN